MGDVAFSTFRHGEIWKQQMILHIIYLGRDEMADIS